MSSPRLTVLMSVYNGAPYLQESVESILRQSYRDFRFVVIDDGSTDESAAILTSYRDPRVVFIPQENRGLAAALNRGLDEATGEFIARQDQDDISLPGRLAAQLRHMEEHPDVGLLGTRAQVVTADGSPKFVPRQATHPTIVKWMLLFGNHLTHSSVMIRRRAIENVGAYTTDPERQPPEDYELWSRIAGHWEVANLSGVWVKNREVPGSMTRDASHPLEGTIAKLSLENMHRLGVPEMSDARLSRIREFVTGRTALRGPREMLAVLRDLWTLERRFCAHYRLQGRSVLALKLHNRRRLLRRVLMAATKVG